eukprot:359500-Chlamydomonas_euryale.AAC.4
MLHATRGCRAGGAIGRRGGGARHALAHGARDRRDSAVHRRWVADAGALTGGRPEQSCQGMGSRQLL